VENSCREIEGRVLDSVGGEECVAPRREEAVGLNPVYETEGEAVEDGLVVHGGENENESVSEEVGV